MLSIYLSVYIYASLCLHVFMLGVYILFMSFLLSIYLSTCFLIALRFYAYCLPFIMSLCLIVFSFAIQVIQEYEPRQGIFGVLA